MKIIISKEKKQLLKNTTIHIDTSYSDSLATVLINKNERSLTLITGQKPLFAYCVFILDKDSTNLKDKQFSIDGSYIKQLPHYFASEQDIELSFQTSSAGSSFIELIQVDHKDNEATLRRCECKDAFKEHITYLKKSNQLQTTTVSKAVIERAIFESAGHMPYEFIELDSDKRHIRIQRDGKVEEKYLPKDIKLPISIVMTQKITHKLIDFCTAISGNEIEIAQQGELLTFKAGESSITSSLAGLSEFYTKAPEKAKTLRYVELNFYEFKAELSHCFKEYGVIKKANNALLYLSDKKAAIAVFTEPYKFFHTITVSKIDNKKDNANSLFRFSPKDLLNIKIKDLIAAKSTRLEIIEYSNGEIKLGVYYTLEDKLPCLSIPIEKDESQLPKVLTMLESLEKKQTTTQYKKQEVQDDLFNFDEEASYEY